MKTEPSYTTIQKILTTLPPAFSATRVVAAAGEVLSRIRSACLAA